MEISSSVAASGMRVALQVVTAFRRPVLEVYTQLRNVSGPPMTLPIPDSNGTMTGTQEHRFTDTFFDISLINVGGVRAENVRIIFSGSAEVFPSARLPRMVKGQSIHKFPPGQSLLLFKVTSGYVTDASEPFHLEIAFDGPREGVNRLLRLWSRIRKRPQYIYRFTFEPKQFEGAHLPSPEHNG